MDDIHHFMPGLDIPEFGLNISDQGLPLHNFGTMPQMGFHDPSSRLPNTGGIEAAGPLDPTTGSSRGTPAALHVVPKNSTRSRDGLHQIKLQHLQQLQQMQSQLVNTQMEILKLTQSIHVSDKNDSFLPDGPAAYPTPTSMDSYVLVGQQPPDSAFPSPDLVSPLISTDQVFDANLGRPEHSRSLSNYSSPSTFHQTVSAPARIAFANASRTTPLVSPINPENSELSPIPSPWLRPVPDYISMQPQPAMSVLPQKRNSTVLGEGGNSGNHQQMSYHLPGAGSSNTPNSRIMAAVAATQQAVTSGTRAQKRHKNSATPPSSGISEIGDSNPAPCNPSSAEAMPPPSLVQRAPRLTQGEAPQSTGIEPVTPSSIMGLDIRNPPRQTRSSNGALPKASAQTQAKAATNTPESKGVSSTKTNAPTQSAASTSTSRATSQRKQAPQPLAHPPKKHTHKDAEQKRRDSLKNSFDELRDLLPPIPLALEDPRFADNPPLPGSLPPRGPPKGDAGPNRHVSKLHVLRCGNDYIRQLKGRVERRDMEIERLRVEIRRMRGLLREGALLNDGGEEIDLEKDLDAEEDTRLGIGGDEPMSTVVEEGEDGNDS